MIISPTQKTVERFKINIMDSSGQNEPLFRWGMKIFYVQRRKCLLVINEQTKLSFALFDVRNDDIQYLDNFIRHAILQLYRHDYEVVQLLMMYFEEDKTLEFEKLVNKSMISSLNLLQSSLFDDLDFLANFVINNNLQVNDVNAYLNFDWLVTRKHNNRKEYTFSGELFVESLIERYLDNAVSLELKA